MNEYSVVGKYCVLGILLLNALAGVAANDGPDFTALSVESTKKEDVVDSMRPINNYVRS